MRLATLFRKNKERRAARLAEKLLDVLVDLELKLPPDTSVGHVEIWVFESGEKQIQYNLYSKTIKF